MKKIIGNILGFFVLSLIILFFVRGGVALVYIFGKSLIEMLISYLALHAIVKKFQDTFLFIIITIVTLIFASIFTFYPDTNALIIEFESVLSHLTIFIVLLSFFIKALLDMFRGAFSSIIRSVLTTGVTIIITQLIQVFLWPLVDPFVLTLLKWN